MPNITYKKSAVAKDGEWLPEEYKAKGYRHVGDSDYFPALDMIIAPSSGWPHPLVKPAFLGVDRETLKPALDRFSCTIANNQSGQIFTPWVAASQEGRFFYSGDYDLAQVIYKYNVVSADNTSSTTRSTAIDGTTTRSTLTCEFAEAIPLSMPLALTQGGVLLNETTLLVASDDLCIYEVDLVTGHVDTSYCFWFAGDKLFEMEGIAVHDLTQYKMGKLHVQAGSFGKKTKTRPIFHLDYIC